MKKSTVRALQIFVFCSGVSGATVTTDKDQSLTQDKEDRRTVKAVFTSTHLSYSRQKQV